MLEIVGVSYIFAPAYLSPVNPIEYFFGIIKKRLRTSHIINKYQNPKTPKSHRKGFGMCKISVYF